jgi:hypothetical protein
VCLREFEFCYLLGPLEIGTLMYKKEFSGSNPQYMGETPSGGMMFSTCNMTIHFDNQTIPHTFDNCNRNLDLL